MTFTKPPEAVLWDMDGTIIDSEPIWFHHQATIIRERGGYWDDEMSTTTVGLNLDDAAATMLRVSGVPGEPEEFLQDLVGRVVAHVREEGVERRPGAAGLIAQFRTAGVPQALVTASWSVLADVVAETFGGFDTVVSGDRVSRGKPDPECYLSAASLLGVDVTRSVAVEDSVTGVAAARAAGARCLAVPHMIEIPAAPGLSRVRSLLDVDAGTFARIADGRAVDHFADEADAPEQSGRGPTG